MNETRSLMECPDCAESFPTEEAMITESGVMVCPACFKKRQAREESHD